VLALGQDVIKPWSMPLDNSRGHRLTLQPMVQVRRLAAGPGDTHHGVERALRARVPARGRRAGVRVTARAGNTSHTHPKASGSHSTMGSLRVCRVAETTHSRPVGTVGELDEGELLAPERLSRPRQGGQLAGRLEGGVGRGSSERLRSERRERERESGQPPRRVCRCLTLIWWRGAGARGEGRTADVGGADAGESSLGDAKSSLDDAKSSLGDAKSSLDDAKSSLGDAKSSLDDAKSSMGDAKSSLGDAESSMGDAESSLGDAKSSLGDVSLSFGSTVE
jgi:hypothetical protein